MLRYLLPLLPAIALAATGDPESATPEPNHKPRLWLESTNDGFAPRDADDGLTYTFQAGAHVYGALIGANYSAYTNRAAGTRADEFTLTFGQRVYEDEATTVTVAAGLRFTGDFGGEKIQDWWHSMGSGAHYHLPYDHSDWEPTLVVDARRTFWFCPGYGAVQPQAIVVGTNHSVEYEARLPLLYTNSDLGGDCVLWIGPGYRGFAGKALSQTAAWYEHQITGPTLVMGARLGGFLMELCLSGNRQYGGFGISF